MTLNPFDNVVCPGNHVTHTLFACDSQTSCWGDQHHVQVDVSGLPGKESCPAPLKSLPPYFSCQRLLQVVAYMVVCDHRQDCADGSDEDFCVFSACQRGTETMCDNKQVSLEHGQGMLVIYIRNRICFGDLLLLLLHSCCYVTQPSAVNNATDSSDLIVQIPGTVYMAMLTYLVHIPLQELILRQSYLTSSVLGYPCLYRSLSPHSLISSTTVRSSN